MATWTQLGPATFPELTVAERDSDFGSPPSSLVIVNADDVRLQIFADGEWESFLSYLGSPSEGDIATWNATTERWDLANPHISKIFQFPAHDEDLAVGVMGARPGTNTGEAGKHGDYTALYATAFAGTAGSGAGATTILIEADNSPAFASPVVLYTLTLTGVDEHEDTVLDNPWAAGDIFVRARCTAIEAVAPKDVNVEFIVKERLFNG